MINPTILWILLFLGLAFAALSQVVPAEPNRVLRICAAATFVVGLIIALIELSA